MLVVGAFAAGAAVRPARLANARSVWLVYSKERREGVSHITEPELTILIKL